MDYKLLKNKIYLTLLAYYNNKSLPSFIQLGKQVGVSRQTASTKYKELVNDNLLSIDENNILVVNNILNINVEVLKEYLDTSMDNFDPIQLKYVLFNDNTVTKTQLAKEMGISRASLYLDNHSVVYGIQSEGKIKYIGTTSHYEDRIAQHIKKRPFLTPSNFLILADDVNVNKFNIELDLIHLLKPEWNEVGTEH